MPKGVEVQLHDASGTPLANQTDITVVWLDNDNPIDFTQIKGKSGVATIDVNGYLKLNIENVSGLAVGQYGFLLCYKTDIVDYRDSPVFASKMEVTTITGGLDIAPVSDYVRPTDWLTMPTLVPGDQKFVGLLAVNETNSNFVALTCSGNYVVNWGDGSGNINVASGVKAERNIQWADISSSTLTSLGYRQALVTVTMQSGQTMTSFSLQQKHSQTGLPTTPNTAWLDCAINGASLDTLTVQSGTPSVSLRNLEVFKLQQNVVTSFTSMFVGCSALQSIPELNTAAGTSFAGMFVSCTALQSIPLLNTAAGIAFNGMFSNCRVLQSVPLLNTSVGADFTNMFSDCGALQSIPLLNTAAGTNFSSMFTGCASLQSIPLLNTVAGTNFSSMLNSCGRIKSVPLLNTAAGTSFSGMFASCINLQSVPLLNTAAGTTFSSMFASCRTLQSIPLLDTAAGTTFSGMFSGCTALQSVPLLNTAAGTIFTNMFNGCNSLEAVPLLNTAAGTTFSSMFSNCTALQSVPLLNTAAGTTFTNMFNGCTALAKGRLAGTTRAISYASLMLSATALDDIYTGLGTASGAQIITVTGNWGTTSDNPTIATAKGWTVTG